MRLYYSKCLLQLLLSSCHFFLEQIYQSIGHFVLHLLNLCPWLCEVLPEQGAVGTRSSAAPSQGGGHREVVHAQRWRLPPALLSLWQQAWRTVAWSLLLVHLSRRQLKKPRTSKAKDASRHTHISLVNSDRNIIELLYQALANYGPGLHLASQICF